MEKGSIFNYIITIHNKEDLIEKVLMSVLLCCRDNSYVYPVLDGCTDQTEEIIDKIANYYDSIPIKKVYMPDVHEILSINAGLRAADQECDGYNIIIQDDVILADFAIQSKIERIYEYMNHKIGMLSFRHGINLIIDKINKTIVETDLTESCFGHGVSDKEPLLPGRLTKRMVVVRSPECISSRVVREVGVMEEELAPYTYDNHDYSLRCLKAGCTNVVFSLKFYSGINWGGMRKNRDPQMSLIMKRNRRYIYEKYKDFINDLNAEEPKEEQIMLVVESNSSDSEALSEYNKAKSELEEYESKKISFFVFKRLFSLFLVLFRKLRNKLLPNRT